MSNNKTLLAKLVNQKNKITDRQIVPSKVARILDNLSNSLHNARIITLAHTRETLEENKKNLRFTVQKNSILEKLFSPIKFTITFITLLLISLSLRKYTITKSSDQEAIRNINHIISNSNNIKNKVWKTYNRDSVVIYPPINTADFYFQEHENFWLSVNRLFPEKRIEMQIKAFNNMLDEQLVIIGGYDSHNQEYINSLEQLPTINTIFLKEVSEKELIKMYSLCKGHITTARDEDFGITPVEAMASGKPVIAPDEGGYKETIINNKTGIIIDNINEEKIINAVRTINKNLKENLNKYISVCQEQAKKFDTKIFIKKIKEQINRNKNDRTAKDRIGYSEICKTYPKILGVGLSNRCNINPPCVMCSQRNLKNIEEKDMPEEILKRLEDLIKKSEVLSLHGTGEPLLSSRLFDTIKLTEKDCWINFNSNGLLLTKDMSNKIINSNIKLINFSIDAAAPQTYQKIRRNNLQKLKENIKYLQELKKQKNKTFPIIRINIVLMKENLSELPEFFYLAEELGAEGVHVYLLNKKNKTYAVKNKDFNFDYFEQMIDTDSPLFKRTIKKSQEISEKINIGFYSHYKEISDLLKKKQTKNKKLQEDIVLCKKPWTSALIKQDGQVKFCCFSSEIGNLKDQTFEEIWNSLNARQIRKEILNNRLPEKCSRCPRIKINS